MRSRKPATLIRPVLRHNHLFALLAGLLLAGQAQAIDLSELTVAPGFALSIYAKGVDNARQMALAEDGTLFVGSRQAGNVYALPDADHDGRPDRVIRLASGLSRPSGVAYRNGALYVADISRVLRFPDVLNNLRAGAPREVVFDQLPSDGWHGWKYLRFAPDGRLAIPVGAPCNVCDPAPPYATINLLDLETGTLTPWARGVRNSVGFDFHPVTGQLWFTDNGRDELGNEIPADELNRVSVPGEHFGFPYFHAGNIADPEFGQGRKASDYVPPVFRFPAHHAPLGMIFIRSKFWPPEYRHSIVVAEHGSWNRNPPGGYRVMTVLLDADEKPVGYQPLVEGWLQHSWLTRGVLGRPADVLEMPDGSVLISDDKAGVIYRLRYTGK